jgi:hypothetical protein
VTGGVARSYFEDVVLDSVHQTPAMTVTEAHVGLYLGVSGEAGRQGEAVPELLPLCLTTGLGWRVPEPLLAVVAFLGVDWEIVRPLRVGDTIHSRSRVAVRRSLRDAGLVVQEREVIDQHGHVAHRGRFTFLVAKRPPEEAVA